MSIATLMEPLAVSIRGLRKLRLDNVHGALILGDGPIGLLMLVLLQSAGIEDICLVGGRDPHLELANDLGVRATFNYHQSKGDLARDLLAITGHHFPVVVEASGSELAIQASLEMVQKCGQILVLGDYGLARASFEWNHLLHQEIDIVGSNASAGAWPEAVSLANQEILPLERFVTHCFPASRFMDGIELARSRREEVIKVVLVWTQ